MRSLICGVVIIILGVGWAAFAILGNGNTAFLTIMVMLCMILGVAAAVLVRVRTSR